LPWRAPDALVKVLDAGIDVIPTYGVWSRFLNMGFTVTVLLGAADSE
jgi:hypothetical protein